MVTHDWNQIAFANLNSTIPSFWCETPNIGKESYLVEQIRTTCDFLKTELHQPTLKYWSAQESHSILENEEKKNIFKQPVYDCSNIWASFNFDQQY